MGLKLPSLQSAAIDAGGFFSLPWVGFFTRLVSAPGPIASIAVGVSPLRYEATQNGALVMTGGAISTVTLIRARVTVSVPAGTIPMSQGDVVELAFTSAPALSFVPSVR